MKVLSAILAAIVLATMPTLARAASMSHVVMTASLDCGGVAIPEEPAVVLSLDDAIVTGREYYPQATVTKIGAKQIQIAFDVPGGIYEYDAMLSDRANPNTPLRDANETGCSRWGPLMTIDGVTRTVSIAMDSSTMTLWDRSDFAVGTIGGGATVLPMNIPKTQPCGDRLGADQIEKYGYGADPSEGAYYLQFDLNPSAEQAGLEIRDGEHTTIVRLAEFVRTPLRHNALLRRDVTAQDLARWRALPQDTVVCDPQPRLAAGSPPAGRPQRILVDAIVGCSDANDLYRTQTPAVEVEDQLHRGHFFQPRVTIGKRAGTLVTLAFDLPPGAYDVGFSLKKERMALPCYTSMRVAVLPGRDRHLTVRICSCGVGGHDRGYVAGTGQASALILKVATIPRTVSCNTEVPDIDGTIERSRVAVWDGGVYYAQYYPYDPTQRPILILSGPGLGTLFLALDDERTRRGSEQMIRRDISKADLLELYGTSRRWPNLICAKAS